MSILEKYKKKNYLHVKPIAVGSMHKNGNYKTVSLLFECECGNRFERIPRAVLPTSSCGCKRFEQRSRAKKTHGKSKSKLYRIWSGMKSRCHCESNVNCYRYGGRGIRVCDRWLESFDNFIEDMGLPAKGMTLERIDNDKGYSRENCKWATMKEQCRNRRSSKIITFRNQKMTLAEAAEISGTSQGTIKCWADKGLDIDSKINSYKPKPRKYNTICVDGKTLTLKEAEKLYGIPSKRISARKNRGWSDDDSVKIPMKTQ